jgi:hypothetical protein
LIQLWNLTTLLSIGVRDDDAPVSVGRDHAHGGEELQDDELGLDLGRVEAEADRREEGLRLHHGCEARLVVHHALEAADALHDHFLVLRRFPVRVVYNLSKLWK